MIQRLEFGPIDMRAEHDDDRPFVLAGQRMYAIGMMSGARPVVGEEHLVGEMGGVWAHPIKALAHYGARVRDVATGDEPFTSIEFVGAFWRIERLRRGGGLSLSEVEWVDEDAPELHVRVVVANTADAPREIEITFEAAPSLRPCWMSTAIQGETIVIEDERSICAGDALHREWGVAVVADSTLRQRVRLNAGDSFTLNVAIAATHEHGADWAKREAARALREAEASAESKRRAHEDAIACSTPADTLGDDVRAMRACAQLNLKLLEARNPAGHYALAGLPEYPNLFGCDTAYSVPGLIAAGRGDLALSAMRALKDVALKQAGRAPHEVLPDGAIFHPGNTQETPQFVIAAHAVWRGLASSEGDDVAGEFAAEFYAACRAAMLNYLREGFTSAASRYPNYPHGNAMVEREGMLPLKLDSVCYTWRALKCLEELNSAYARTNDGERANSQTLSDARRIGAWAAAIERDFERDWWIEDEGLYADSLGWDGERRLDRHWTQAVPLETGLASREHAARVLGTLERDWLNASGLPHTKDVEERVWTLPTGVLALAAARAGKAALAERLLRNIGETLSHGQLGLFEELIPRGLCFVQLWSAALFAQICEEVMNRDETS